MSAISGAASACWCGGCDWEGVAVDADAAAVMLLLLSFLLSVFLQAFGKFAI